MVSFKLSYLIIIFFVLGIGEAANSIYINQDVLSENLLMITCSISGQRASSYKTYLHCPLIDTDICYKDCQPECHYANGICKTPEELKSIENCVRKIEEDDHIRLQYTINVDKIANNNGEWYCSFEGINSKSIKLKISSKNVSKPTIKVEKKTAKKIRTTTKATPKREETIPVVIVPRAEKKRPNNSKTNTDDEIIVFRGRANADPNTNTIINFKTFITNFQVVVGIICFLSVSLLLNFIFCIRDSLIKQFIENIKTSHVSSKYLLCCICQSDPDSVTATAKLDKILSKEMDHISNNLSNCSKTDLYHLEANRPLITPVYYNSDAALSRLPPSVKRSSSLQNPDMAPRGLPVSYEQICMTAPRGYQPYMYNPYVSYNRNSIGIQDFTQDDCNQVPSNRYQPMLDSQNKVSSGPIIYSKPHASQNDIDLISHCDKHGNLPQTPNLTDE